EFRRVLFRSLTVPEQARAMEAARDSASARITAPLPELREGSGPGLVIYAPVYRSGIAPGNPQARTAALVGWVCTPFRLDMFVARALPGTDGNLSLRVVDIGEGDGDTGERPMFPIDPAGWPGAD